MDEVSKIGKISKQWTGLLREAFTDSDNFGIQFPMDLDVRMKAVMIGACFLIVSAIFYVSLIVKSKSNTITCKVTFLYILLPECGYYRCSSLIWPSFHGEWFASPHWQLEISCTYHLMYHIAYILWEMWPEITPITINAKQLVRDVVAPVTFTKNAKMSVQFLQSIWQWHTLADIILLQLGIRSMSTQCFCFSINTLWFFLIHLFFFTGFHVLWDHQLGAKQDSHVSIRHSWKNKATKPWWSLPNALI